VNPERPLRIVVTDNDQAVLDLLLLDLRLEGHDVVATATTGEDAVRRCDDERPDVLVVDYRLGRGINGVEVAERVRRDGLRVVLFTNYVNPDVVAGATAAGAVVIEKGNLAALRRAVVG
jgi:two-component system response regulator HydG